MTILFGIPNCNQVKNARTWLDAHQQPYVFHDFKKSGVNPDWINIWLKNQPWDVLINKKGTTWRNLSEERKASIVDTQSAIALMLESPSIIKRPVLCISNHENESKNDYATHVGFSEATYQTIFK